jgi:hypothetical protein
MLSKLDVRARRQMLQASATNGTLTGEIYPRRKNLPASFIDPLREWHNFYAVLATASATLLGAMFVVASIGGSLLTKERAGEVRLFVTPTVIHLSAIVFSCAAAMVPSLDETALGVLFGAGGAVGLLYSATRAVRIRQRRLELVDHFWYAAVPTIAYAIMIAAAVMALSETAYALELLAISIALLLAAAIRNAWDLLLFVVAQTSLSNVSN